MAADSRISSREALAAREPGRVCTNPHKNPINPCSLGVGWGVARTGWSSDMKKFMVLYMASAADFEKMMQSSTPEQQKKGMDIWMKW